jgi:hypothetical protein
VRTIETKRGLWAPIVRRDWTAEEEGESGEQLVAGPRRLDCHSMATLVDCCEEEEDERVVEERFSLRAITHTDGAKSMRKKQRGGGMVWAKRRLALREDRQRELVNEGAQPSRKSRVEQVRSGQDRSCARASASGQQQSSQSSKE